MTMDDLLQLHKYDEACRHGAASLPSIWDTLRRDPTAPLVVLKKNRRLRPLFLGVFVMEEKRRDGLYYSLVTQEEVEKEEVVSTTIAKKG